MSTALTVIPPADEYERMKDLVRTISQTEFVPKVLLNRPHAILACVLTGRELGIGPMESLRSIYVVDGKPTLAAELQLALVRRAGHKVWGEATAEKATVHGLRVGDDKPVTVTWAIQDAQRAGLVGKNNWKQYPAQMLWARAVSQLITMHFSDVLIGTYTPDEMGADEVPSSEGGAGALASPHEADDTAIQAPPSEEVIEGAQSTEEPQEGVLAAPPDQEEQGERPEGSAGMIGTSAMTPASPAQGAGDTYDRPQASDGEAGPPPAASERASTAPVQAPKHRGRPKGSKNKPKEVMPNESGDRTPLAPGPDHMTAGAASDEVEAPAVEPEAAPESAPSLVDSADGAVAPLPPSPLIDDGLEPLRSEVLVKATELRRLQFQKKQKQAALAGQRIEVPEGDELVKAAYEGLTTYIERKFGTDVKLLDLEREALDELRNELAQFAATLAAPAVKGT